MTVAERLVNELMLVSVLVAGDGAGDLAGSLEAAGAAAEVLAGPDAPTGFDLAILLTQADAAGAPATRAMVDALARASDRLLLAPLPLGPAPSDAAPALPELPQWFELFAELGYQPVIEFDASFVSAGAFLVDRAATAAEGDLAAFTDRLQLGAEAATQQRAAVQEAERSVRTELQATRTTLAAREADIDALRLAVAARDAELDLANTRAAALAEAVQAHESVLREAEARNTGWDGVRSWLRQEVAATWRNELPVLARDLARLNALRAPDLPPVSLPASRPRTLLARLRRRPATRPEIPWLADAALVRASPLFDAAWYVASHAATFEGAALDPVFHYVLVGGPRGADPGPWFDAAAYLASHPGVAGVALVEAIRRGEVDGG